MEEQEPVAKAEPQEIKSKVVDFRAGSAWSPILAASAERDRYVGHVRSLSQQKESTAKAVALIITWTFAVSAVLILIGLYCILRFTPGEAKGLIADGAVPFIKEAGLFLSSTFGPLLAFVLGYYFGEKTGHEEAKSE